MERDHQVGDNGQRSGVVGDKKGVAFNVDFAGTRACSRTIKEKPASLSSERVLKSKTSKEDLDEKHRRAA